MHTIKHPQLFYPARYVLLVIVVMTAFALRLHDIGRSSLRGDEAFTIRYWAQSPAVVLDGLAWVEPHPFGAFFSFWAWKSAAGDSEFAMRLLPALVNLLGIPALYSIARTLLKQKSAAWAAAAAWAFSANLIWHSQDARNYAMWAGVSAVALAALLRASTYGGRWRWGLYIVFSSLGLYLFFLEPFFLIVHGLWIAYFRKQALRTWVTSAAVIGVLLIPWVVQIIALSGSGYRGTATRAEPTALISVFLPALFIGEDLTNTPLLPLVTVLLLAAAIIWLWSIRKYAEAGGIIALLLVIPSLLLVLVSTRMDVFRPRYLLAVTPAFALLVACAWAALRSSKSNWMTRTRAVTGGVMLFSFSIVTAGNLATLYAPEYSKAPAWRELRSALQQEWKDGDSLILVSSDPATGILDPASGYYFPENKQTWVLPHPDFNTQETVNQVLEDSGSVWVVAPVGTENGVESALSAAGQRLWHFSGRNFQIIQYRTRNIGPDEVTNDVNVRVGDGHLTGYRIEGSARSGSVLRLFLYWDEVPSDGWKTFVHLIGPTRPDGTTLWAQDDHPPQAPGRDVYLIDLNGISGGEYALQMGLYAANSGERAVIYGAKGQSLGDVLPLQTISITDS